MRSMIVLVVALLGAACGGEPFSESDPRAGAAPTVAAGHGPVGPSEAGSPSAGPGGAAGASTSSAAGAEQGGSAQASGGAAGTFSTGGAGGSGEGLGGQPSTAGGAVAVGGAAAAAGGAAGAAGAPVSAGGAVGVAGAGGAAGASPAGGAPAVCVNDKACGEGASCTFAGGELQCSERSDGKPDGYFCTGDSACASGWCDKSGSIACSSVCASDDDCGGGWLCAGALPGQPLRCERPCERETDCGTAACVLDRVTSRLVCSAKYDSVSKAGTSHGQTSCVEDGCCRNDLEVHLPDAYWCTEPCMSDDDCSATSPLLHCQPQTIRGVMIKVCVE